MFGFSTLLIVIIAFALVFDYINGFHDSANSIATIVSTKVLTPFQAVLWAALWNFVAYFVFKEHKVANTVAKTIHPEFVTLTVILAGLLAAIFWNLLTWWFGIPSSSSHTLIGGFIGAALAHTGGNINVVELRNVGVTVLFIFLSPIIGMILSFIITIIINWVARKSHPYRAEKWFKRLQLLSSAAFSLGHGGNDAQKVMGLITVALLLDKNGGQALNENAPILQTMMQNNWIPFACYTAIGLGTMSGGWRIVKTMGSRITKVTPIEGVAAETASASTLILTEALGVPVSTTHTVTGAIMGVGATKRLSAVRWGVTVNLIWAWILTIPVSAGVAALVYWMLHSLLHLPG
ncbi:inorganic phosphate transporter [Arachidicoccus ginsenosidimutans]|uniref:inorganic phosphate transporter n=1 Tax=Arachidicoccus sp. BS20 TaxID=1850526 RepID=UPI0007F17D2C|nr:inorganic phosphate transporter [Arachidicoccus sp. BS20]ANI88733.1 inorganic phosphate transporter [Arachidicoccus sp. BS20]